MTRRKTLYFNHLDPPIVLVSMRIERVCRSSRSETQVWGHIGDYEVAIVRPATEFSDPANVALVQLRVTRLEKSGRGNYHVWGHVSDYEVCIELDSRDGRVKALLHLHNTAQQISGTSTKTEANHG